MQPGHALPRRCRGRRRVFSRCIELLEPRRLLTDVSGHISSDTVWTVANSPYNLVGDTVVDGGKTLTIQNGVTVNFQPRNPADGFNLFVDGTVNATGANFAAPYADVNIDAGGTGNFTNSTFAGQELNYAAGSL